MSVIFSSINGIDVSLNDDGSYSWKGQYNGTVIKRAIPIDIERCIILLDPDASNRSVFENLLCIDRNENLVWRAKPPSIPDVFVEVALTPEGLWASAWSGLKLLLDQNGGSELKRIFVK
jgi:hypothetical protein